LVKHVHVCIYNYTDMICVQSVMRGQFYCTEGVVSQGRFCCSSWSNAYLELL